ncbi:MAG: ECF-type sigma factor [Planctomycetota bacterium]|jgi:RNA polymerase sigma factor (TIGR02999 family)
MTDVTRILNAIEEGDARAADELLPLIYEELRMLAARKMAQERPGQTLQATALVHEAYIRLVGSQNQHWKGHTHFFAAAAEAMRRILIENARRKKRLKRGGDRDRVEMQAADLAIEGPSDDVIALDEALNRLARAEQVVADLVKLRYFAGLTLEQAAEILGIGRRTADRYWAYARAWLHKEIAKGDSPNG